MINPEEDKSSEEGPGGEIGKCLFKSYFGFKDRWGNLPGFFPCSLLISNNLGEEVGILSDEI